MSRSWPASSAMEVARKDRTRLRTLLGEIHRELRKIPRAQCSPRLLSLQVKIEKEIFKPV